MIKDERAAYKAAVKAASDEYDADIYLYSGAIDDEGYGKLIEAIAAHKVCDRAILILTTNGGSANAGYQIARLFQKTYEDFTVCAPSFCKSAGTLVALGAHRLLIDNFCDLGPLDVQLFKQNEIAAKKSGLLSKSSFDALGDAAFNLYERLMIGITMRSGGVVNFKLASELSASMAGQLLAQVYSQINPDIVGSEHRDLNIALEYGFRLVDYSENASDSSVIRLVQDYPSHDFIIDNDECAELFKDIDVPSERLYEVLGYIRQYAYDEPAAGVVIGLTPRRKQKDRANERNQSGTDSAASAVPPAKRKQVDADRPPDRASNTEPTPGEAQRAEAGAKQGAIQPQAAPGNDGSSPETKQASIKVVKG